MQSVEVSATLPAMGDALTEFWRTLSSHAPLLLVVLPVIGAALVAASARWGREAVRRTALTNAALSCGVALVMAIQFDRPPGAAVDGTASRSGGAASPVRMVSSLRWAVLPAPAGNDIRGELRLTVGVDGISLGFLASLPFLVLAALVSFPGDDESESWGTYFWLLAWESLLAGAFAALDAALWSFCLLGSGLPAFALIGGWGGPKRREAARTFSLLWTMGGALMTTAAVGLAASLSWLLRSSPKLAETLPLTFDLPTITRSLAMLVRSIPEARDAWQGDRSWIAIAVVAGGALLAPMPAWGAVWRRAGLEATQPVKVLLIGSAAGVGGYALLRLLTPLPEDWGGAAGASILFAGAALFSGLRLLRFDGDEDVAWGAASTLSCVAFAGGVSANRTAEAGSALLLTCLLLASASAMITRQVRWPAWLALAGAPPFGTFAGVWMVGTGLFTGNGDEGGNPLAAGLCAAAATLSGGIVLRRMAGGRGLQEDAGTQSRIRGLIMLALVAVVLAVGAWPDPFVRRILSALPAAGR